jgi:hypothetical protein
MSDPIDMICILTDCTPEMAREIYDQTKDVTIAVDKILFKTELPPKKKQVLDDANCEISKIREVMKQLDKKMDERPDSTVNQFAATSLSQRALAVLNAKQDHREETVLQNNYSQECQIPVLQLGAEKPEIACPSPSELISYLQSNVQTLRGSDHQYHQ